MTKQPAVTKSHGNTNEELWDRQYNELVRYQKRYKHCRVNLRDSGNRHLAAWVGRQRKLIDSMSEEKRKKLNDIGFDWNPRVTAWNEKYQELADFKRIHGHCNVPKALPEYQHLAYWINKQRFRKLSEEKIKRLRELGFDWSPHETAWNERYQELVEFKRKNGHCVVPVVFQSNPQFGTWVRTQRKLKRSMSEEKIKKLNEIGFVWKLK